MSGKRVRIDPKHVEAMLDSDDFKDLNEEEKELRVVDALIKEEKVKRGELIDLS